MGAPARLQVRVQNISDVSKWIRFHGISESADFDVKYENPQAQTPPGLEATAEVLFNGRPVPEDGRSDAREWKGAWLSAVGVKGGELGAS